MNSLDKNGCPLEIKLRELHSSLPMLLVSIGLVSMLYVDNLIIRLINKDTKPVINKYSDALLFIGIMLSVILTYFAHSMTVEKRELLDWIQLSYIFIIFIAILIIYKAKSLSFEKRYDNDFK
jgi:divalent metal cation (Fe/Co/Zn/Cd) transporter